MNYKRITLAVIVGSECLLSCFLGYKVYSNLKQRNNVLGAHYVTHISKASVVFPEDQYLSGYYEPKANSIDVETPPWIFYTTTYTYNSDGLRADKDYEVNAPSNVFRIIALGDSFTEGVYMALPQTYVSQLEQLLNNYASSCSSGKRFEILNFGMRGYDIAYETERYRRHGIKYHPDLVMWLINANNVVMPDALLMPLTANIEAETTESARLKYEREQNYYFASNLAREQLQKQYSEDYIFSLQRHVLDTFNSLYSGPLLITMFDDAALKTKNVIADFVHSRKNTYFYDTLQSLSEESGTQLLDGHPSVSGHAQIAHDLYQYLTDHHIISCKSQQ